MKKTTIFRTKVLLKNNDQLIEDDRQKIIIDKSVDQYKSSIVSEYKKRGLDVNVDVTYS